MKYSLILAAISATALATPFVNIQVNELDVGGKEHRSSEKNNRGRGHHNNRNGQPSRHHGRNGHSGRNHRNGVENQSTLLSFSPFPECRIAFEGDRERQRAMTDFCCNRVGGEIVNREENQETCQIRSFRLGEFKYCLETFAIRDVKCKDPEDESTRISVVPSYECQIGFDGDEEEQRQMTELCCDSAQGNIINREDSQETCQVRGRRIGELLNCLENHDIKHIRCGMPEDESTRFSVGPFPECRIAFDGDKEEQREMTELCCNRVDGKVVDREENQETCQIRNFRVGEFMNCLEHHNIEHFRCQGPQLESTPLSFPSAPACRITFQGDVQKQISITEDCCDRVYGQPVDLDLQKHQETCVLTRGEFPWVNMLTSCLMDKGFQNEDIKCGAQY